MLSQPQPTHPIWALQVLTPDYIIDGLCDTERYSPFTFCSANYQCAVPTDALQLEKVKLKSVGPNLAPPPESIPNWNITFYNGFIAVIPNDEASTQFFHSNLSHYPMYPVDVYAGPYLFRGDLPIEKKDFKKLEFLYSYILKDVEIDCLCPDSFFHGVKVPYAMVRTLLVQGMVMRN
jgi:hypothetical protein